MPADDQIESLRAARWSGAPAPPALEELAERGRRRSRRRAATWSLVAVVLVSGVVVVASGGDGGQDRVSTDGGRAAPVSTAPAGPTSVSVVATATYEKDGRTVTVSLADPVGVSGPAAEVVGYVGRADYERVQTIDGPWELAVFSARGDLVGFLFPNQPFMTIAQAETYREANGL